ARALWAGQRPLGIVWAISDHPPLGPDAEERLADAARVVELHLIRLQGRRDPDRWRRSESLRAALDSAPEGNPGRTDLGLEPDDGCVVLAIAPDLEQDRAGHAASVPARIVDLVTLLCEGWD